MKRSYRSVRLVKSTVFIAYSRKRHFSLACFDRCMLSFVTKCNPKFCGLFHHWDVPCIGERIYCYLLRDFQAEPDLYLFIY